MSPERIPRPSLITGPDGRSRCGWVGEDALYRRYHDEEWGRPLHGDAALYEKICLEGFQAGLSWISILRRRDALRAAFFGFEPARVAAMGQDDIERLLADASIIRNRAKITAAITNARATLALEEPLSELIWGFMPLAHDRPTTLDEVPAATAASHALSAELRRRGFRFVGPTTAYALMQSAGLVDDHLAGCWRSTDDAASVRSTPEARSGRRPPRSQV